MIQRKIKQNLVKATVILCFFAMYASVFTGCSQSGSSRKIGDIQTVAKNVNGLIVCDKALLNETITLPLSFFIEGELQIVKLDDSDEALVKNNPAVISENYIPVESNIDVYNSLFDEYAKLHDYFGRGQNDIMKRLKKLQLEVSDA